MLTPPPLNCILRALSRWVIILTLFIMFSFLCLQRAISLCCHQCFKLYLVELEWDRIGWGWVVWDGLIRWIRTSRMRSRIVSSLSPIQSSLSSPTSLLSFFYYTYHLSYIIMVSIIKMMCSPGRLWLHY